MTRVGFGFVTFLVVVLVAASNTGNNGLYLVLATMTAMLVLSYVVAALNVRGLNIEVDVSPEIFARRPAELLLQVSSRRRLWPHWLLVLTPEQGGSPGDRRAREPRRCAPGLLSDLRPLGRQTVSIELLMRRRGERRIAYVHAASIFPLGLFRKGRRYPVDLDLLVYPEIFPPSARQPELQAGVGETASRRRGHGHDLLSLRGFRDGDDPRGIHWKQSARTGRLIYKEREAEENRRLVILFDNGVGSLEEDKERQRFEQLVSEAATAALGFLDRGFEVALVSRDGQLSFAAGGRQRRLILRALALVEPCPRSAEPLQSPDPTALYLRLAMEGMQ